MKRKLSGALSLLLATSMLLCGCGEKTTDKKDRTDEINGTLGSQTDPATDNATVNTTDNVTENTTDSTTDGNDFWDGLNPFGDRETLYLLTEYVNKNDAGEVLSRYTYTYDDNGLVTSYAYDFPVTESEYDEEQMIFVTHQYPCDGIIDYEAEFSYDQHGNPTSISGNRYGKNEYKYTYDHEGRVRSYTSLLSGSISELEYRKDGTIEIWHSTQSRDETPAIFMETSADRLTKMTFNKHAEGVRTYYFEYDAAGNLTECGCTNDSEETMTKYSCTYDKEGRVISETSPGGSERTYEYEDGRLAAIDGEKLRYSEGDDGELIVTYQNFELTYEPIELAKEEIELVRNRWNQFCGIFNSTYHDYLKGLYGIRYPVFNLNTVLLLPKGIVDSWS